MNLGDKLKNTLDILETARIRGIERQSSADLAKIAHEQAQYQERIDGYLSIIAAKIEGGGVPLIKVTNYDQQTWLRKAMDNKASHQYIWDQFVDALNNDGLAIVMSEAHDGGGMQSWINLSVKPVSVL